MPLHSSQLLQVNLKWPFFSAVNWTMVGPSISSSTPSSGMAKVNLAKAREGEVLGVMDNWIISPWFTVTWLGRNNHFLA